MTAEIPHIKFRNSNLGTLAYEIKDVIFKRAELMSVAEVIGTLEVVKLEIIEAQK